MKTTGMIVLIIGVALALFCGVAILTNEPIERSGTLEAGVVASTGPNVILPMIVAVAAVGIGTFMLMYGGRGYYITQNPNVRN